MKRIGRFLERRLIHPLLQQLRKGVSPRALAAACAKGFGLGAFPLIGTTTALCFVAGTLFKLNQPILQAVNYLMAPMQLLCIPLLVALGDLLAGGSGVIVSPVEIVHEFAADFPRFMSHYGLLGLQAIGVWAVVMPLPVVGIYGFSLRMFQRWAVRPKEVS